MANEQLNFDRLGYDEKEFFPRDTINYRINGTQTSSTSAWKGNLPEGVTEYGDGLTIDYYLPASGISSTPATLTLSPGPAKTVWCLSNNKLVPVTIHIPAGAIVRLSYVSSLDNGNGGWLAAGDWSPNQQSSLIKTTSNVSKISHVNSGTLPSLGLESISPLRNITSWNTGSMFEVSISNGVMSFTAGSEPVLDFTAYNNISVVKSWSAGDLPTVTYSNVSVLEDVNVNVSEIN